jgi:hypothetical protein
LSKSTTDTGLLSSFFSQPRRRTNQQCHSCFARPDLQQVDQQPMLIHTCARGTILTMRCRSMKPTPGCRVRNLSTSCKTPT